MAVPINVGEDRIIYVVDISMGRPFRGTGRDIDELTREITYKYGKDKRNRIGAARQKVNMQVDGTCMKFFKTRFTSAAGKATLETACREADKEMSEIDSSLHVTPNFFEVRVASLTSGNMFDQMKEQLSVQVHEKVLARIQKVIENQRNEDGTFKPMSNKSRTALLTMLEKVREINILGDASVEAQIEKFKAQITEGTLIPMRDEILAYIEDVQGADALDILDAPTAPETPQEAKEADEYKAKPLVLTEAEKLHIDDLLGS
jgi:hypothetical protein